MTLVSGTTTDGTWLGTTTLPPGNWDITVEASVATGSEPSLLAGTVSVAGATAPPSTKDGNAPSSATGPGEVGSGASSSPAPQPAATAAPTARVIPAPAMSSTAAAPSQPPTGPARGVAARGWTGTRRGAGAAASRQSRRQQRGAAERVGLTRRRRHHGPRPGFGRPWDPDADRHPGVRRGRPGRIGVVARRGAARSPSGRRTGRRYGGHRRPASPASRAPALDG